MCGYPLCNNKLTQVKLQGLYTQIICCVRRRRMHTNHVVFQNQSCGFYEEVPRVSTWCHSISGFGCHLGWMDWLCGTDSLDRMWLWNQSRGFYEEVPRVSTWCHSISGFRWNRTHFTNLWLLLVYIEINDNNFLQVWKSCKTQCRSVVKNATLRLLARIKLMTLWYKCGCDTAFMAQSATLELWDCELDFSSIVMELYFL